MAMSGVIGGAGRGLTSVPSEFGGNTESVFVPCCVEEVPAWLRAVFSVACHIWHCQWQRERP